MRKVHHATFSLSHVTATAGSLPSLALQRSAELHTKRIAYKAVSCILLVASPASLPNFTAPISRLQFSEKRKHDRDYGIVDTTENDPHQRFVQRSAGALKGGSAMHLMRCTVVRYLSPCPRMYLTPHPNIDVEPKNYQSIRVTR